MNYEEMSDIVIDRKIFSLMFGDDDKDMERIWKGNKFRPCSKPDLSFPIILKNGISLVFMVNEWEAHWLNPEKYMDEDFSTIDKNPLRAAMICFLKMKDSECKN